MVLKSIDIGEYKKTLAVISHNLYIEVFGPGEPVSEVKCGLTFWRVDGKRIRYPQEEAENDFYQREMGLRQLLHDEYGLDLQPHYVPGKRLNPETGRSYNLGKYVRMDFSEHRLAGKDLPQHVEIAFGEFPWLTGKGLPWTSKHFDPTDLFYVQSVNVWATDPNSRVIGFDSQMDLDYPYNHIRHLRDSLLNGLESLVDDPRLPHRTQS